MQELLTEPTPTLPPALNRRSVIAVGIVVTAFFLPVLLVLGLGLDGGPQFADEREFHLPTIEQFARQWPAIDFKSYPAAMTPGYHLLMAGLMKLGMGLAGIRVATVLITVALVSVLTLAVSRALSLTDTVLVSLPIAWSPYVFGSAVSIAPHNLAWLGVLSILLLCLHFRAGAATYLALALSLMLVVLARQIHLWLLAPILIAVAWPARGTKSSETFQVSSVEAPSRLQIDWRKLCWRAGIVLLLSVPSLLVLRYFYLQWGGMAPTTQIWVKPSNGVNWPAIAMMLATFGFVGIWYIGQWTGNGAGGGGVWTSGLVGGVAAFAIAAAAATNYDKEAGRWTGLWNLARALPTIGDHSPAIIALATLGGFVVAGCLASLRWRERAIFAAAIAGFVAAHASINQAWCRYYEPMFLLFMALACSERPIPGDLSPSRRTLWGRRAPLLVFAAMQLTTAIFSVRA